MFGWLFTNTKDLPKASPFNVLESKHAKKIIHGIKTKLPKQGYFIYSCTVLSNERNTIDSHLEALSNYLKNNNYHCKWERDSSYYREKYHYQFTVSVDYTVETEPSKNIFVKQKMS